jgi:hypothetical protein
MVDPDQIRGQLDEVAKTYAALALEKRDPGERESYLEGTLADMKDQALKGGMAPEKAQEFAAKFVDIIRALIRAAETGTAV